MWARAWAKAQDRFEYVRDGYMYLANNEGIGMLLQGQREWTDYRFESRLTPRMAVSSGMVIRVQGLRRYYALLFTNSGEVRLEKNLEGRKTLAQVSFPWEPFEDYIVEIEARGNEIRVWIDGKLKLSAVDSEDPLLEGAFGYIVESGCHGAGTARIMPA
jgi:hypothetical protein